MPIEDYRKLANKWMDGTINPEELKDLERWYNSHSDMPILLPRNFTSGEQGLQLAMFSVIKENTGIGKLAANPLKRRQARWWWAAAILFVVIATGIPFLLFKKEYVKKETAALAHKDDIQPGHNGAVLHLSDGSTIVLESKEDGTVANQSGVQVVKENDTLKYVGNAAAPLYNMITTNRGNQWALVLPDGTKVWLNAASSIRYPLAFNDNERIVELTGEAYFEVKHNNQKPFKIKVGGTVVEDLGTAFNVNAYDDEPYMKMTLVEGKIKVYSNKAVATLSPSQQAMLGKGSNQITIKQVDIEKELAWKSDMMEFNNDDLPYIMREISRWYNVTVKYEGRIPGDVYQGTIPRYVLLSEVMQVLKLAGVEYKIENNTVVIMGK